MKMNKQILRLLPALALAAILPACGGDTGSSPSNGVLQSQDIVVGTGATAVAGDTVTVSYVGSFTNGTVFDSGTLPPFRVGTGSVIKGFDDGIIGMRVGGKRHLIIPPNLGYGSQANGPIPANSTLVFDVTLLAIAGK